MPDLVSHFKVLLVVGFLFQGVFETDSFSTAVFPAEHWETRSPEEMSVDPVLLDEVGNLLGGRGCVIKDGFVIKTWGDQKERTDWLSSAKPVLSTLLFFALQEGLVKSVDQPIADFGWPLRSKDRSITFRHLGSMTSGYRRPEGPGQAWAYNDSAIMLYQRTLFDKVFKEEPHAVSGHPDRFGALGFEDGSGRRLGGPDPSGRGFGNRSVEIQIRVENYRLCSRMAW